MTGGALVDAIVETSGLLGWIRCHFRPARTARGWRTAIQGDAGFPDLVLVRAPRLIFAEIKGDGDELRPDQVRWLDALREVSLQAPWDDPFEVYVWTAPDWRSGEVERLLR